MPTKIYNVHPILVEDIDRIDIIDVHYADWLNTIRTNNSVDARNILKSSNERDKLLNGTITWGLPELNKLGTESDSDCMYILPHISNTTNQLKQEN